MSSTIQRLSLQLQKSPEKVTTILPQILDVLLKSKDSHQIKWEQIKKTNKIFLRIISKIDEKKQRILSQFVFNMTVQLIKIQLYTIIQYQSSDIYGFEVEIHELYKVIEEIFIGSQKMEWKNKLLESFMDLIMGNELKVNISSIKSGYMLCLILESLQQRNIYADNIQEFQNFLLSLDNFNQLKFPEQNISSQLTKKKDLKLFFKQIYQNLFIQFLESISQRQISIADQTKFYNKLGQKVFSKLSNPLVLSQFFIKKFSSEDENPQIQIQILSSLFILVGKHGLQLQKFYENLQRMIKKKRSYKQSIFRLSNSKRFLKLIEAAMRTSKIPLKNILNLSHLLLNLVMNQPSQLIFWFLSFFVNLVKKHRQLQSRLSQFTVLQTLKYHYSPVVRNLIKQLQKNLNKAQYLEIEDFTKVNCQKLCDKKLGQIRKKIGQSEQRLQFKLNKMFQRI